MPEIKIARVLQKIFIHFPQIVIKLMEFDDRIWNACCRFAVGELSYSLAKERIGGFKGMRELMVKILGGTPTHTVRYS